MVRVSKWQHASSRRIGESCALLWRLELGEKQTILVRKMKDPKNRNKQKVVALPWDAQDLLYEWAYELDAKPELRNDEPRILPFNSKTCSQRYTKAKKLLGIENLHLHDSTGAIAAQGSSKRTGTRPRKRSSTPGTTRRTCSSGRTWCSTRPCRCEGLALQVWRSTRPCRGAVPKSAKVTKVAAVRSNGTVLRIHLRKRKFTVTV
jgi:hypothetical protein